MIRNIFVCWLSVGRRFARIPRNGTATDLYHRNQSSKNRRRRKRVDQLLLRKWTPTWKVTGTFACPASRSFSSLKCLRKKRSVIIAAQRGCIVFSIVCLCVCKHDKRWTVRDIISEFSGRHPAVERAEKFENGCVRTAVFTVRHLATSPTISSQPLTSLLGFVCVPQTDTSSSYLVVDSTHTAVGRFRLLVRRSETRCLTNSETRRVSDGFKQFLKTILFTLY